MSLFQRRTVPNLEERDDDVLVSSVIAGNVKDFEKLMRRYNQRNFRLARAYMAQDSDAMDVVQEAYITAYTKLPQYIGPARFSAWLGSIVRNEALMRLRRNQNVHYMSNDALNEVVAGHAQFGQLSQTERVAGSHQLGELIEQCINRLPENFRVVFMMRGVEQLSVQETAELVGIPPETVKTRYHRARRLLQDQINRQIETEEIRAFEFAGNRCDQIVRNVIKRINELRGQYGIL